MSDFDAMTIRAKVGPYFARIPHSPEDGDTLEAYARGILKGICKQATPNCVAGLLATIRACLARITELEAEVQELEGDMREEGTRP